MIKAAATSLLAISAVLAAPGMVSSYGTLQAQTPADQTGAAAPAGQTGAAAPAGQTGAAAPAGQTGAAAPAGGQVQMDPAEFAVYDNAINKQTTPQTQAPALEDYLQKYPKSAVKADVLQRIMIDYSQFDHAKAIDAADKVLQLDPNNLQAYTIEVAYRRQAAEALTDPAARQTGMDAAADYAKKGLAATKPTATSDADFKKLKDFATPTFYSAIGADDLAKKDSAGAIEAYKAELAATPEADTEKAGTALQDTYFLGQAYYTSQPPDYVNCTFYATRAASFAPDNFKPQLQPLASFCYKKYHGSDEGYDAVVTAAKASLNPPADFKITPAPSLSDVAAKTVADTPDLATLALSDKEFILENGKPEDADKVFDTIKGKNFEIPGATVMVATPEQLQVAVSDEAVASKTPDFTYNMKEPLKTVPAVGDKVDLTGTYASYTQNPLMIVMSDGEEVKKAAAKPVHHAPVHHPVHHHQ